MAVTETIAADASGAQGPGFQECYAIGKSLRNTISREALADYDPPDNRDPNAIIEDTVKGRLKSLRPERRKLMLDKPFAFLRGAADIMAFDLSRQRMPGIKAQACGDCHIMNFGAFASPENNVLFDVNDFDETLPHVDVCFDLRRLATSVVVAAVDMGYSAGEARVFARRTVKAYREQVRALAVMSPIEIWNVRVHLRDVVRTLRDRVLHDKLSAAIYEGKGPQDRADGLPKIERTARGWRFVDKPPKLRHLDEIDDPQAQIDLPKLFARLVAEGLQQPVTTLLERYTLRDTAFKAVGVGSVGVFCAIGLFMSEDDQPLALQIKEAQPSVLERFGIGTWQGTPGKRVTSGQRVMQAASDIFLADAEDSGSGRRFYMRHLKTRRLGSISELLKDQAFPRYVELCGSTLARAHARSTQPAVLAGYMGKSSVFDDAIASFAALYAKQTSKDYKAYCADPSAA